MKKLKKALSLTLALALSLALAVPAASAAGVEDYKYVKFSNEPNSCNQLTIASNEGDQHFVVSPMVYVFPDDTSCTITIPDGGSAAYSLRLYDNSGIVAGDGYQCNEFKPLTEGDSPTKSGTFSINNGITKWSIYDSAKYNDDGAFSDVAGELLEEIYFCKQSVLENLVAKEIAVVEQTAMPEQPTAPAEPEQPAAPAEPEQPAAPKDTSVTVGGKAVEWTDAKPFIDANDRTMVPLRAVADAMGLKVVWYAAERQAAFTNGSKVIYFPIDNNTALTSGGGSVQMDTAAVIANDRTYAPIRYLAEFFGYEVGWDGATSTVTIAKGNREGFICGETEPHQWQAANYQAPETCSVCGATQGSPLTPDFVTYGMKTDVKVGEHYKVRTICYENRDFMTDGDFTVLDYKIIKSDADHAAKDGYEWRVATFQIIFNDENAWNYGYSYSTCYEGYYDIRLNDDSSVYTDDNNSTRTVNYYGEDRESFCRKDILNDGWQEDGSANITYRISYQAPVGYDGFVSGVHGRDTAEIPGGYINENYNPDNYFLFRFS